MDPVILGELLIILLLIGANGFFSGAEMALVTANRSRLKDLANAGDRAAIVAMQLAQSPNRFLAAVQLGISLVGTLAAAFGGATLVETLRAKLALSAWQPVVALRTELALAVVSMGIALASIVFGELVPKRIALHDPVGLARIVARPIDLLSRVARPLLWLLEGAATVLLWPFGIREKFTSGVSLEEIRHLIELGTAEGVVRPVERQLAVEALELGNRTVRQIMKPRIDIDAIDVGTPQEVILGVVAMAGFSRLPIYEGDLDHIIGFVHLKDVLRQHYLGWKLDLRKLIRPALIVPDTMRLDQLLVQFQEQRNQLAIVVDEFGSTRGMVTLEDVLEELVGELLTEHHKSVEEMIVRRDDSSWLVDGQVSIADLLDHLDRRNLVDAAPRHVSSVAGLVLDRVGRIPSVGEKVVWQDLQIEVVDMDGQRIDRVIVSSTRSASGQLVD